MFLSCIGAALAWSVAFTVDQLSQGNIERVFACESVTGLFGGGWVCTIIASGLGIWSVVSFVKTSALTAGMTCGY
jgi:hypothetical protein